MPDERYSSTSLSSVAVSLGLAAVGYVSTTLHTVRAQQHKNHVERVGEQLKNLYGPLLACVNASKSSFAAMVRQYQAVAPASADFRTVIRDDPNGPAAAAYRQWVREVLMPLSERAGALVIDHADLLEGGETCNSNPRPRRSRKHNGAYLCRDARASPAPARCARLCIQGNTSALGGRFCK